MKFGVNEDVNRANNENEGTLKQGPPKNVGEIQEVKLPKVDIPSYVPVTEKNSNANVLPTLGGAITAGFLIAKYVI